MKTFFTGLPLDNMARENDKSRVHDGYESHLRGIPYVNDEYKLLDSSSESEYERLTSISSSFKKFLIKYGCKSISNYLDLIWGISYHDKVGLEIGGPGRNFFKDLNPDGKRFKKTIGLTAKDIDRKYVIADYTDSNTHPSIRGKCI